MERVVACFKWVMDDADIRVNESTRALDFSKVKPKISEYDRNAIEAAAELKRATGCEVVGLTAGTGLKTAPKDALSRGLDSVSLIDDASLEGATAMQTAKVLASAIKDMGGVDAVICGEGSSDQYNQQTGPRLAALLGMPSISCVSAMEMADTGLKLIRKLEDGSEEVMVKGPVVISVMPDINEAPIPSLKQILAAKKKPVNKLDLGEMPDGGISQTSVLSPVVDRKQERLNPDGVSLEDAAKALAEKLKAGGIFD
jgi:electron transfer flavoprotein beta subunit